MFLQSVHRFLAFNGAGLSVLLCGDLARDPARIQMAEKPPSTANSPPFTKHESSEARNGAAAAISSGSPIVPRGITASNICFASNGKRVGGGQSGDVGVDSGGSRRRQKKKKHK